MELELNEVIENLEYLVSDSCTDTQFDYIEEIEIATKSLKKQMPKKPDFTEDKEFVLCPCCNGKGLLNKQKYCDNCGQKLDWSEESEE